MKKKEEGEFLAPLQRGSPMWVGIKNSVGAGSRTETTTIRTDLFKTESNHYEGDSKLPILILLGTVAALILFVLALSFGWKLPFGTSLMSR